MYRAVTRKSNGSIQNLVVHGDVVQSFWLTFTQANQVANDLNKSLTKLNNKAKLFERLKGKKI